MFRLIIAFLTFCIGCNQTHKESNKISASEETKTAVKGDSIAEYNDENGLHHIDTYFNDSLIQRKIYEESKLTFMSPIIPSSVPKNFIRLKSGKDFLKPFDVDTIEAINSAVPIQNRSYTTLGGLTYPITDSSFQLKIGKKDPRYTSVIFRVHVSYPINDSTWKSFIGDSLVIPIK